MGSAARWHSCSGPSLTGRSKRRLEPRWEIFVRCDLWPVLSVRSAIFNSQDSWGCGVLVFWCVWSLARLEVSPAATGAMIRNVAEMTWMGYESQSLMRLDCSWCCNEPLSISVLCCVAIYQCVCLWDRLGCVSLDMSFLSLLVIVVIEVLVYWCRSARFCVCCVTQLSCLLCAWH